MIRSIAVCIVGLLLCVGCGSTSTNPGGGAGKPFMEGKKQVPAGAEWSQDFSLRNAGTVRFRVSSGGPFAVTVITDKGFQAAQRGDKKAIGKEDALLTIDSKELAWEKQMPVPAGRSWIMIQNQADKEVEIQLECFDS